MVPMSPVCGGLLHQTPKLGRLSDALKPSPGHSRHAEDILYNKGVIGRGGLPHVLLSWLPKRHEVPVGWAQADI